ncbi:MAG: c-type cytochrome domain-containing protein [Bacteroidota bacterium]
MKLAFALGILTFIVIASPDPGVTQDKGHKAKSTLTFTSAVGPIIKKYCLPCHLEENENPSGLALDDYERLLKGGNHGNTVVPGKPKESNLYLKLTPTPPFGKQMARNKKKLTDEEVKTIYDWIEDGAKK